MKIELKAPYTQQEFDALPYNLREGVLCFWEPGYDYLDPDFWDSFDPEPTQEFIDAVIMYDWLQKQEEK